MKRLRFSALLIVGLSISSLRAQFNNPWSIYSTAIESAGTIKSKDPQARSLPYLKKFLSGAWFFLPDLTSPKTQQQREEFRKVFSAYPEYIPQDKEALEKLCPLDELCPPKSVTGPSLTELTSRLKKQCEDEKKALTAKMQTDFAQNLEKIQAGYNQIYLANLDYAHALQSFNEAYAHFRNIKQQKNIAHDELLASIKIVYYAYKATEQTLQNLQEKFVTVNIILEIGIPDVELEVKIDAINRSIEVEKNYLKLEPLSLKKELFPKK